MPYRDRNLTRWILLEPAARELYVDWAQIAAEMVAILRLDAGAHPDDPRTTELVGELTLKSWGLLQVVGPAQGAGPHLGP